MKKAEASGDKVRNRMVDQLLKGWSGQMGERPKADPAELARQAVRDSKVPKKESSNRLKMLDAQA